MFSVSNLGAVWKCTFMEMVIWQYGIIVPSGGVEITSLDAKVLLAAHFLPARVFYAN